MLAEAPYNATWVWLYLHKLHALFRTHMQGASHCRCSVEVPK